MDYSSTIVHRLMIFDDQRNSLYAEAINNIVDEKSVVIDLGAGIGIHGLLAAQAGAKKVYLVEPAAELDVAARVADQNGLFEKIKCIRGNIEESNLPESANIIISVFSGNFLLEEDLLPSLFFARDKYLTKDGTLIPDRAKMEVVPVTAADYFNKNIACWSKPAQKIDFSLLREFAANFIYYDDHQLMADAFLAEPVEILDMDFMTATSADCRSSVKIKITQDGLCHGMLGWFKIRLGDAWLSTSPLEPKTHWRQAFLPLDPPILVKAEQLITFELNRPEYGEWTWTVETPDSRQQHSTFLSEPLSTKTLHKKSDANKATLDTKGKVALFVLNKLNGDETTIAIAKEIMSSHPDIFPDQENAKRFVITLIERFC